MSLPRRRLTLRMNFSWTFVGSAVYAAAQWGMLVLLTKLGSPEMVGLFAIGLAVTMPILSFATLKTRLVQATDAQQTYLFGHYFGLRLITTAVSLVVIYLVTLVIGYERHAALIIFAVGVSKAVESISDVLYGLFQQRERMDVMAISRIMKGTLSLIALAIAIYLTKSLLWGIASLTMVWLVVLLGYDLPRCAVLLGGTTLRQKAASLRPNWNPQQLGQLAWLALPLGIVVTLESLATQIPRFFIERQAGVYLLGIFAAMAYLKRAGQTVIISLGLSAAPRLARHFASGNLNAYQQLLHRMVLLGVVPGLGGVLIGWMWGRPLLILLYRPEYAAYQTVFVLLMVAAGIDFVATFLDYGMTAARQFRKQMVLFIGVVIVQTIVCSVLIPRDALTGAAIAVIAASSVRLLGGWAVIYYAIRKRRRLVNQTVEQMAELSMP